MTTNGVRAVTSSRLRPDERERWKALDRGTAVRLRKEEGKKLLSVPGGSPKLSPLPRRILKDLERLPPSVDLEAVADAAMLMSLVQELTEELKWQRKAEKPPAKDETCQAPSSAATLVK